MSNQFQEVKFEDGRLAPDYGTRILDDIVSAVTSGLSYLEACKFAGIKHRDFRRWMQKASKVCQKKATGTPMHTEYYPKILKALVQCKKVLLDKIREASQRDWKAAAYLLERLERFENPKTGSAQNDHSAARREVQLTPAEKTRVLGLLKTIDMKDFGDEAFGIVG